MTQTTDTLDAATMTMDIIKRHGTTIFIRLPRVLWRSAGYCNCDVCKGGPAFWDTLAVDTRPVKGNRADCTWSVHMPSART